MNIKMASAKT